MRNILLICPKFFGYEKYIKEQLLERDYNVYVIYENIHEYSAFFKILTKYIHFTSKKVLYSYYKTKLRKMPTSFEYLLIIRGSSIDDNIIKLLDEKHFSKKVMYQWDSIRNNPHIYEVRNFFDKISTFDSCDAAELGWNYRPLFYIKDLISKLNEKDIDLLFLGSLHSDRIKVLRVINQYTGKYKIYAKLFIPLQSYLKNKLLRKDWLNEDCIVTKAISLEESYDLYSRTKVVVDYAHPKQTGLTMRTLEALGNSCIIITNNEKIENESFYNPKYVFIYKNEIELKNIIENINLNAEVNYTNTNKYEISAWLNDIL